MPVARSLLQAACFAVAGAVLAVRAPGGLGPPGTLYPWWLWVVGAVGLAAALAPLARQQVARPAAAATAVLGLQLAGTGVVAWKHWRPVSGMTGIGTGHLPELEAAALVLAGAGLVAAVLAAHALSRQGGERRSGAGPLRCALAGVAVLVLVPAGTGASHAELRDLTSLGAVGLAYAGPWAAGLLAAAVLPREAARGAVLAVALTAGLATIGPQMRDLLPGREVSAVFAAVLVVALLVLPREVQVVRRS